MNALYLVPDADPLKPCPFCGCEMVLKAFRKRDHMFGNREWFSPEPVEAHRDPRGGCNGHVAASASIQAATDRWNMRDGKLP